MDGDLHDVDELLAGMSPHHEEASEEKFRELILHIALMSEVDPFWGATKLNKILFYSDFLAYLHFGKSITGQEYQAIQRGPAPRRLLAVRDEMVQAGELAIQTVDVYQRKQQRAIALREPDLTHFSAAEIALVDRIIKDWWGATASDMSRKTHNLLMWALVEEGETIPYELALLDNSEPTADEISYARTLVPLAQKYLGA